jgi:acetoin utilization deacetylase AcuC-like enzyme
MKKLIILDKEMLNISFTSSEEHYHIDDHYENPQRVIKTIEFFKNTEPYKSFIINNKLKEDEEIILLIINSQGDLALNTFNADLYLNKIDDKQWLIGYDTYVNYNSFKCVKECISILMSALDSVNNGVKYQYCIIRPPGHHHSTVGKGFCLINNIFILSEYAISKGFNKVLILDYDFHHCDGTAKLVKNRVDSTFVISIHGYSSSKQYPVYPGTGSYLEDTENVKNFPLHIKSKDSKKIYNDDYYMYLINGDINNLILNFNPDIILVSNGLDAHKDDPIGKMNITNEFFIQTARKLKTYNVPLIYVLEGGYNPDVVQSVSKDIVDELII